MALQVYLLLTPSDSVLLNAFLIFSQLDSIEMYDPRTDRWSYVGHMFSGGRIGSAVAVFQEHIYIIGGYSMDAADNPVLSEVLCFDLLSKR